MDVNNPVIQLCLAGCQAEFQRQPERAAEFYRQAWEAASDDYEACIAAHYRARFQPPQAAVDWNLEALRRAQTVEPARVEVFMPSLYLSLGQAYEQCGETEQAQRYYALAAGLGVSHQAW